MTDDAASLHLEGFPRRKSWAPGESRLWRLTLRTAERFHSAFPRPLWAAG